jgi:hypothetical protein
MVISGGEQDGGDNELPDTDAAIDEAIAAEEQLMLTGDDDALPWLEADDDDIDQGSDYRILIFGALAVLALAAILFGAKHFLGTGGADSAAPDGSTIAAEDGAYKSAPENPGGEQVAGTGDLSFEVGEGQGGEEVSGAAGAAATPSIDVNQAEAARPSAIASRAPAAAATASAGAASSGVGVQVGAYSSRAAAEAGWNQLIGRFDVLSGANHRIVEGTADSGTIYRLQAVSANVAAAETLCRTIRNAGGDCQVKR